MPGEKNTSVQNPRRQNEIAYIAHSRNELSLKYVQTEKGDEERVAADSNVKIS